MNEAAQNLTEEELELIDKREQIVAFDEQAVRSDHASLLVVRFTVNAPKSTIDAIRKLMSSKIYVDESDPPEVGVNLPMPG